MSNSYGIILSIIENASVGWATIDLDSGLVPSRLRAITQINAPANAK